MDLVTRGSEPQRLHQQSGGGSADPAATTGPIRAASPSTGRLIGLDAARGLAVLGMFVAHFNPYQTFPDSMLQALVSGRSAGLFAVLAGITTALLSGGSRPPSGLDMRERRLRIAVRAVLLFAVGLVLSAMDVSVKEILTAYGALFLLALPLLRVRPRHLAVAAAVSAVAGPVLSYALRSGVVGANGAGETMVFGNFTGPAALGNGLLVLTVTGVYPLLTWLPFLLAGMAVGRLRLGEAAVRRRLVVAGVSLTVAAYGLSWLLMNPLGGFARIAAATGTDVARAREAATTAVGVVPTVHPAALLTTASHSGAPLEIAGVVGLALAIVGILLVLADRAPRVFAPLTAVGRVALSAYVGHIVVIWALGPDLIARLFISTGYLLLVVMVVGTTGLAAVWTRWAGQGPLERPVSHLSKSAAALLIRRHRRHPENRRSR
ncbi:uncharacterized protein DUF1624 [Pseudonocardia sediminis]|uniref:Uncharacterized protein DUF1624 n=1 Tax=Pseudonocardia sediminis TaxID=1397368 RepID=A0A4V6MEE0_PSEST|nr:heparan-alpha-glucosaminide N-acetyltransferase domain-containing protein [Pseudonocardia sediminis]RZT88660.1 uncharacterized protein DUF1624 [Pseudonocardia sediminis]